MGQKDGVEEIIRAAKVEEQLRIWYSSCPESMCGYYHLIYNLKGIACDISSIKMPKNTCREDGFDSWIDLQYSADIKNYLALAHRLDYSEREELAAFWERLIKENTSLRLNINETITSVSEDYLDEKILMCAPVGQYKLSQHLANCLTKCRYGLDLGFYTGRIEALIKQGKLRMIKRERSICRHGLSILEKV